MRTMAALRSLMLVATTAPNPKRVRASCKSPFVTEERRAHRILSGCHSDVE